MNTKGQGHSLALDQGHSDSTFSHFFSLETAGPTETKFYVEPPWDGGMNVCSNDPAHIILLNQKVDDLETPYAALDTQELPNLCK